MKAIDRIRLQSVAEAPDGLSSSRWLIRLAWMFGIWTVSVLSLGAVAGLLRFTLSP